jgi:8-oxo-dGTP pyrophosphatase MutT (NUDIX family)
MRELREETGLVGRLLRAEPCFVHTTPVGGQRPHRHWNLAYAVEADAETPTTIERDEVRWFDVGELPTATPVDLAPGLAAVLALLGSG